LVGGKVKKNEPDCNRPSVALYADFSVFYQDVVFLCHAKENFITIKNFLMPLK